MNVEGTISIVSHGHGQLIGDILGDLNKQEKIERWFIILTLNIAEEINVVDYVRLRIKVVQNKTPKGFGANHNTAAAMSEGRLLAIINPDIRLTTPDTLVKFSSMEWTHETGQLRAPLVLTAEGAKDDSVRQNLSIPNLISRARERKAGWEIDPTGTDFFWLAGMFLIFRRDAFLGIGGFNEKFFLYCEDYDLSARWRLSGGSIELIDSIEVVHNARRNSHRSAKHFSWHFRSLLRVWFSPTFWRITLGRLS